MARIKITELRKAVEEAYEHTAESARQVKDSPLKNRLRGQSEAYEAVLQALNGKPALLDIDRRLVKVQTCECCGETKVGVRKVYYWTEQGSEGYGSLMCRDCEAAEAAEGKFYQEVK